MSIHSRHKPLIFSPLCGMIHLELWGYKISPWILPKLWLLLLPPHLLPHQVCRPNSRTWGHIPTPHWAQSQPLSAKLTKRGHSHLQSSSCNGNQHYSSLSWNATTSSITSLATYIRQSTHRMSCHQLPSCNHHMDALQNPQPQPCSPYTTWFLSFQHSHSDSSFPSKEPFNHIFNFDNNFLSDDSQYDRKTRKNINISNQKTTNILKFYCTNYFFNVFLQCN